MSTSFSKDKVESVCNLRSVSSKSNKIHLLTHTSLKCPQDQRKGLAIQTCAHFNKGQQTAGFLEAQRIKVSLLASSLIILGFFCYSLED